MKKDYNSELRRAGNELLTVPRIYGKGEATIKVDDLNDTTVMSVSDYGDSVLIDVAIKQSADSQVSDNFEDWMNNPGVFTYLAIDTGDSDEDSLVVRVYEFDEESGKKNSKLTYTVVDENSGLIYCCRSDDSSLVCETTCDAVIATIASGNFEKLAKGDFKEKVGQM